MSDWLPAITIDEFIVEHPRARFRRREASSGLRVARVVEHLRRRYETTVGAYLAFSPRRDSRVEHRVECAVDDVMRSFGLAFHYDPIAHEFRAPTHLHLPWSWPRLPIWLSVSEASARRAVVAVQLRSRTRWRYPLRYYAAAHTFLRATRSG